MKKYDICVFGGCSLDITFFQNQDGTYNIEPDICLPGGKGSNQAVAASRAGAKVVMISRLGNDSIGKIIIDNLCSNGVLVDGVELVDDLKNDSCKIYIDKDTKDNTIIRENGAIDSFSIDMIEKYKEIILNSKIVVAQMKIPKEVSVQLINFCYSNNIPIIITPCRPEKLKIDDIKNLELIDKISYITLNRKECATIFGTDDIVSCVKKYPNKLIVTLGEEGLIYFDGNEVKKIDAIPLKQVVDTTGAGDTFNGNLAALLARNVPLYDAIYKAQFASAIKIGTQGAQAGMPYEEELNSYIEKYNLENFPYANEFQVAYEGILSASSIPGDDSVKKKDDNTFVTEKDLFIEKYLIDKIISNFPNDNFLSEETNSKNQIKDRTWIIDPIDGTNHYIKNSLFLGTQLAFYDKNEIQFSIIYIPTLNEIYYALNGKGTYLNHLKKEFCKDVSYDKCIVEFCGSVHKLFDEKLTILKELTMGNKKVAGIMHINSCCFAFANLISGRTDALVLSTKKAWDIFPGMYLLEKAGITKFEFENLLIFSKSKELIKEILKLKVAQI